MASVDRHGTQQAHRGACIAVAMFVAQVPQVDSQLVELVVLQVPVGQQAAEEGEGQAALLTHPSRLQQRGTRFRET